MANLAQGQIKIERQEDSALPFSQTSICLWVYLWEDTVAYFSLVPVKIHNFEVTSGATPSFYIFSYAYIRVLVKFAIFTMM